MTDIYLGFNAFDVHELLCHGIAETGGLYRAAGLRVKLLDTTFVPDEALPENTFHAACGAALASFLSGCKRKVVFVACDRPMFWLYGRPGIESITELAQGRVATFPEVAPPEKFLQKLLRDHDIAPGLIPCRDDMARLAMVVGGSVDAALLSSRYLPAEVTGRGCTQLSFIGEEIRLPSTGLAVSGELYHGDSGLVGTMVGVYREAMNFIFADDRALLEQTLQQVFSMPEDYLTQVIEVIRNCYNPFGYSYDNVLSSAVEGMAAGMELAARDPGELYEFKYIKSYN